MRAICSNWSITTENGDVLFVSKTEAHVGKKDEPKAVILWKNAKDWLWGIKIK